MIMDRQCRSDPRSRLPHTGFCSPDVCCFCRAPPVPVSPRTHLSCTLVASCLRSQQWDAAYGVLQKMQRQGVVPLDLRPSRFTTAPGEPGEARDRVLRLLQHLRSKNDARAPPSLSSPEQRAGSPFGRGGDGVVVGGGGSSGGGSARPVSRQRGENSTGDKQRAANHSAQKRQLPSAAGEKAGTTGASGEETSLDELLATAVRPREEDFLAELKGAAKTKSWEAALRLLDGLREAGYQPRPGAYACAIRYKLRWARRGTAAPILPRKYRPTLPCLVCVLVASPLARLSAAQEAVQVE